MNPLFTKENLLGFEPKHLTYVKDQNGEKHDLIVVKEKGHFKGTDELLPRLRFFRDYKRPFYITKKGFQTYKQKRDAEPLDRVDKYMSTQIDLRDNIAKALGYRNGYKGTLKMLCQSPNVYGTDVSPTAILKDSYKKRFPGLTSFNVVAGTDIENNMLDGSEDIILQSITCKDKGVIFFLRSWFGDCTDLQERFTDCMMRHIGQYVTARNLKVEVRVCETPAQIVIEAADYMHKWKPDFVCAWNFSHEIKHFVRALENENIDPAEVFSDPSVPPNYRYFDFEEGQETKVSQSGKSSSRDPQDRWSWATHPATFQFIDSMTVYRNLRLAEGKDPEYSLDYMLMKELGIGKLRFKEAERYHGLRWHEMMQEHWKLEYAVYNLFDSLSLELLDEKTNDLALRISTSCDNSDYSILNSNPKRLCDAYHFWQLNRPNPKVIASTSNQQIQDIDKYSVDPFSWVVTLASHFVAPEGTGFIKDAITLQTLIRIHVADLDVEATYPNVSQMLNISPETVCMELSMIENITLDRRKAFGVNLTAGKTNAIPLVEEYFKAPSLDELLEDFIKDVA